MGFEGTRRDLLKAAVAAALAGLPRELFALAQDEELVDFDDLSSFRVETRAATPRVKFFDLRRLTSLYTPQSEFFEFHQTETVRVNAAEWRLRVTGFVDKPREFTLEEIKQRADKRDLAVTVECSGNMAFGAFNGQVSTGLWTGVSLAAILKECGVKPEAREVVFLGLDVERERNATFSTVHGRSVFVQDALDPNAMLAYALNGEPLTPEHGFPLRVILPGWYGMTQIKWLAEIQVLDRRYEGTHMARNYHTIQQRPWPGDEAVFAETSISKTKLKSVVARVTRKKDESGRRQYIVRGAAWGGAAPLKSVEISIDEKPWQPATLGERNGNYAWVLWSLPWNDVTSGPHTVVSRAIDEAGNVQPTAAEFKEKVKTLREDNSQWPRRIVIT